MEEATGSLPDALGFYLSLFEAALRLQCESIGARRTVLRRLLALNGSRPNTRKLIVAVPEPSRLLPEPAPFALVDLLLHARSRERPSAR